MTRDDFEKMHDLLNYIFASTEFINNYQRTSRNKLRLSIDFDVYDDIIREIFLKDSNNNCSIRFKSFGVPDVRSSFVRNDNKKQTFVTIGLCYDSKSDNVRIGNEFFSLSEFTEEQLFQYSLIWRDDVVTDLEFIMYLKSRNFSYNFTLRNSAVEYNTLIQLSSQVNEVVGLCMR
jgi:hypothetical protein